MLLSRMEAKWRAWASPCSIGGGPVDCGRPCGQEQPSVAVVLVVKYRPVAGLIGVWECAAICGAVCARTSDERGQWLADVCDESAHSSKLNSSQRRHPDLSEKDSVQRSPCA